MSPAALSLLRFMPSANLSGDTRNFHVSDTTQSTTDTFTLRITHTFTQPQAGRGGRGGAGAGRGGAAVARAAGRPPRAHPPAAPGRRRHLDREDLVGAAEAHFSRHSTSP